MPHYRYHNLFTISFIDEYLDGLFFCCNIYSEQAHSHAVVCGYEYTYTYKIKW